MFSLKNLSKVRHAPPIHSVTRKSLIPGMACRWTGPKSPSTFTPTLPTLSYFLNMSILLDSQSKGSKTSLSIMEK